MQRHNEGHRGVLYRVSVREKGKKIPAPRIRFGRRFPARLRTGKRKEKTPPRRVPRGSERRGGARLSAAERGRGASARAGRPVAGLGGGSWAALAGRGRRRRGGKGAGWASRPGGLLLYFFFFYSFFSKTLFQIEFCVQLNSNQKQSSTN